MDNIKYIAENLGKTGMPVEKIADVLEMDLDIVGLWLDDAGIDPKNYKDVIYKRQLDGITPAANAISSTGRSMAFARSCLTLILSNVLNKVNRYRRFS